MDKKIIGQKISELRKEKGWTQKELAEKLGVTDKSVSKWETGVNFPDIAILESLAAELGTSVADLLGLEQAGTEEVIREMTEISTEEKEKIKKGIYARAKNSIIFCLILSAAEIYLSWELHKIGLEGGIYGRCTTGLLVYIGYMMGYSIYSILNVKKL